MTNRAKITSLSLDLPAGWTEDDDAITVRHPRPAGTPDTWSLSICNTQAWVRGDRQSLVNFVESLGRRLLEIPQEEITAEVVDD